MKFNDDILLYIKINHQLLYILENDAIKLNLIISSTGTFFLKK
jgi:hypothetical protein